METGIIIAVVFLFVDIMVVGISMVIYSGKTEYSDGMILGVHVPAAASSDPEVCALCGKYKKTIKVFNRLNMLAGIAVNAAAFAGIGLFILLWCLWLAQYLFGLFYMIYGSHRKMYAIKIKRQWIREESRHLIQAGPWQGMMTDDDEYWQKGWYNNPGDSRLWVQDQVCSTNVSMNMARPAAKVINWVCGIFLGAVTVGVAVLIMFFEGTVIKVDCSEEGLQISAAVYRSELSWESIVSARIVERLPEKNYNRTNGGDTDKLYVGHFSDNSGQKYRMFIYKNYEPVLELVTKDVIVYVNSKNSQDVKDWYDEIIQRNGSSGYGRLCPPVYGNIYMCAME